MLNVSKVTKKYGKVIANEDISFEIADGQIGVLLGPNGAGKSTIIKCIIGFLKYQGEVTTYKLTDYKEYKEELLRRFELDDKKKKFGDELSKGMQQKLSICCGLLPRPKLILFDEPMIGLDPHAIKELKFMLQELKDEGASILVSTHMIDSIEGLWDTTYIMMKGKVAAVVKRDELTDDTKSLEDIFFEITEGGKDNTAEEMMEEKEEV